MRANHFITAVVSMAWVIVIAGCAPPRTPQQTVTGFVGACNDKNLERLLESIDPAKENLAHEVLKGLRDSGISLGDMSKTLPGLIQLAGNPVPDDWRLEDMRILDQKLDGDLAWINVSVTVATRVRDVRRRESKKLRFALHDFPGTGWRIIDIQCEPG